MYTNVQTSPSYKTKSLIPLTNLTFPSPRAPVTTVSLSVNLTPLGSSCQWIHCIVNDFIYHTFSESTKGGACVRTSFLEPLHIMSLAAFQMPFPFQAKRYSITYTYHLLCIHSSVNGPLGCFPKLCFSAMTILSHTPRCQHPTVTPPGLLG